MTLLLIIIIIIINIIVNRCRKSSLGIENKLKFKNLLLRICYYYYYLLSSIVIRSSFYITRWTCM